MTDHDRLYKELLTTFFPEFLQLFLPQIFTYLDKDSLTFIDKEIFSSIGTREKYEVDLVVKARIKQTGTVFLIHTEAQSHKEPDFDRRMFRYFARLYENHGLRVYPIALLSFDEPQIKQPSQHIVRFPDLEVLKFNYRVVQLNRLDHKKFLKERNPIAAALIGKMNIARKDYPKVRLECMKMLSGLNLDDARKRLIVHFIGTYLKLNREEKKEYEDRLAKMAKPEKEAIMEIVTEWELLGRKEGRKEEALKLVERLLQKRFGQDSQQFSEEVRQLSLSRLESLNEALLDISNINELELWLKESC